MDEVQKGLPALMRAQRQQTLAAGVGFDWDSVEPVFDKVKEELAEVFEARKKGSPAEIAGEVGDLLYACVNLARHLKVDAESALLGCVEKFSRRYRQVEEELSKRNLTAGDVDLEYLDALWEKAKERENPDKA